MNLKACLFDLDGTLIDSMGIWQEIDLEYLSKKNIEIKIDIDKHIAGMSFTETAIFFKNEFKLEDSVKEIMNTWEEMAIEKYSKKIEFKKGAISFLKELKEKNIKIAIATSNGRKIVDTFLKERNLEKYIDKVLTSCDVKNSKPAPDIYLELARIFAVKNEECLVFEDILEGIIAGKSANMITFAVDDAFSKEDEARKRELADYYIYDFMDVKKYIKY